MVNNKKNNISTLQTPTHAFTKLKTIEYRHGQCASSFLSLPSIAIDPFTRPPSCFLTNGNTAREGTFLQVSTGKTSVQLSGQPGTTLTRHCNVSSKSPEMFAHCLFTLNKIMKGILMALSVSLLKPLISLLMLH